MAEEKLRTKTEEFQLALQAKVSEILGVKVSKQKAWDIFKEMIKAPFGFIVDNYDKAGKPAIHYGEKHKELELPLSGVGTFKVITTGNAEHLSVKPRFYVSSAIDSAVKVRLGFKAEEVEDVEVEAEEDTTAPATPAETKADDIDLDI